MTERRLIAVVGRRDQPTDAVEEYCRYLGSALQSRGFHMELVRMSWAEQGWGTAFRHLRDRAREWVGTSVLLQYTALGWSARGFPLRFLRVVRELSNAGVRVAIVYHDVESYSGNRVIDLIRRRVQLRVMRQALKGAELAIFTVPLQVVSWLGTPPSKAVFIPVGANLPEMASSPASGSAENAEKTPSALRVAVFGITGGEAGRDECRTIVEALRFVATNGRQVQLHAFGRGALERGVALRQSLNALGVAVLAEGVLPAEQVAIALGSSDVALFVRGAISSRRGSAIAGISCGVPVLAYAGPETAAPITDAGVLLVSREDRAELGQALLRLLSDPVLRASLAERNRRAHRAHFAWDAIAGRYAEVLGGLK